MTIENGDELTKFLEAEQQEERVEVIDKNAQYWLDKRKAALMEVLKDEKKVNDQLDKDRKKLEKASRRERQQQAIADLEEISKKSLDADERRAAKMKLSMEKIADDAFSGAAKSLLNVSNSLYDKITKSAEFYGDLLGQMETRLLGSGKTYSSVADMITKTFAVSPFFSMENAMKKTSEFIEKGIAYNVEVRASMAVLSEKVASTFDAFDSTLLRTIKLQQADSTAARLGMENMLNRFLNEQFQDTSYLSNLSDSVASALIEAESRMSTQDAVGYEYAVQKWLGSISSVGASDNLVTKLAQGFGYLGSGDISSLNANSELETLLVSMANRGSGRSYGDILTNGMSVSDVSSLMIGLRDLVSEIEQSGNIVALNQYAKVFGMTVSDLTSILNLEAKDISAIANDMMDYNGALANLKDQSSMKNLASRTSDQEIMDNLLNNLIGNAGQQISSSAGGYFAWKMAGMVNEFMDGIETGIDFSPFGVGGHLDLKIGDITRAVTVMGGLMSGLGTVISGINSITGINLDWDEIGKVETITRGDASGLSTVKQGKFSSETTYVGNTDSSSIYATANATANQTATQVTDTDMDEEKEKTNRMQEAIERMDENLAFIAQMMNSTGIVIRGNVGSTKPVSFFNDLVGTNS